MGYLDIPRLHFQGKFFTDPSTVNNDPTHYDQDNTRPSPWQMPFGQHRFQFRDCKITAAMDANGPVTDDLLLGAPLITTDLPCPARIVDLDVYQQAVTTLFGLQLRIVLPDLQSVTGTLDPIVLNGAWFNCVLPYRSWQPGDYEQDSFGGDMNAAGYFHSVLRIDMANWPASSSALLTQLRGVTLQEGNQLLLSCRFVLDGFQNTPEDKEDNTGRIVGTLGPVFANEPRYNAGQRWMKPRAFSANDPWYSPSFNDCSFKVDKTRKKLVIDMANSICRQAARGGPVDLGNLVAQINSRDGLNVLIGTVDYSEFAYNTRAHITELDLTDAQITMLDTHGLSLVSSRTDIGNPVVLTETAGAPVYAVETRPIRIEGKPGSTATTQVYVSLNGVPVANKQLNLLIESVHGSTPGATVPPNNPGNTPQADGAVTASISPTDAHGFATVTMTVVKDPGVRTEELDGQVYFIVAYDPDYPAPNLAVNAPIQEHCISVLAFSDYPVNENPSWTLIQNMFVPYMKLYPGMRELIDLTDLHTFTTFSLNPPWPAYGVKGSGPLGIARGAIPYYLNFDFNDPRYMPITRDMSPGKIMTVFHFIKNLQQTPPTH